MPKAHFQGFTECLEYNRLEDILSEIHTCDFTVSDVTHEYH